jgi:hypothetical protein
MKQDIFVLTLVYKAEDPFCHRGIIEAVGNAGGQTVSILHTGIQDAPQEVAPTRQTKLSDLDNQAQTELGILAASQGITLNSYISRFNSVEETINSLDNANLRETALGIMERFYQR